MISVEEVIQIHEILIENFGGTKGVRDKNLLESSVNRPYTTFGASDLYPTPIEKAAAVIESIVKNHPFIDGNKRTGYTLMRLTLLSHEMDIQASEEEKYGFVIQIAESKLTFPEILKWIKSKLENKS